MVYLIPTTLADEATETIPPYVIEAVLQCPVIFAENLRTARRFLKRMRPAIQIDHFEWYEILKNEGQVLQQFKTCLRQKKNIAIMSEAGCPGIADPGQGLIMAAQELMVDVKPLVGPSSILLSLMASGFNGQHFTFNGYLPIESDKRIKKIKQLEESVHKRNCTQLFIETPYRNDSLLADLCKTCQPGTLLCIASEITSPTEWIKTAAMSEWKKQPPALHKKPVIFLLGSKSI